MVRLNKYLAECGICSRREADGYISQGRVRVNGVPAENGMKVSDTDVVELDEKPIGRKASRVVLAYYKPRGVTCTREDKYAKVTIAEALDYPVRLTYAGRLDRDSEGLIIMTNDGRLIDNMMRGANMHEKEYDVRVDKPVTDEFIKRISQGIYLEELGVTTRECSAQITGRYTFRIILTQGLNRQIRRMCGALGYNVRALKRIRVVNIGLNGLHSGEYREIEGEELASLYRLCGMGD